MSRRSKLKERAPQYLENGEPTRRHTRLLQRLAIQPRQIVLQPTRGTGRLKRIR